jgi:hypothetical protein
MEVKHIQFLIQNCNYIQILISNYIQIAIHSNLQPAPNSHL